MMNLQICESNFKCGGQNDNVAHEHTAPVFKVEKGKLRIASFMGEGNEVQLPVLQRSIRDGRFRARLSQLLQEASAPYPIEWLFFQEGFHPIAKGRDVT